MAKLKIIPLTLKRLNWFVETHHRHLKPVQGHRFSLGCIDENGVLVGACSVGRPVSREVDQYYVAEITRLVTDGTKNACSILYAAAARTCREMGFVKIQTYILDHEPGTSLRAAAWVLDSEVRAGSWNSSVRLGLRDVQKAALGKKQRWKKDLQ